MAQLPYEWSNQGNRRSLPSYHHQCGDPAYYQPSLLCPASARQPGVSFRVSGPSQSLLLPLLPMLTMGARQALYACLMLASTMLAVSHAAAQKLPARDLDVLGPGSFSHSLANTQREQAAAQLQASGVKVTPLSAAAGTITAGAPAAAAKPTSGTTSPAAAAKAGAKYGATDKFAVRSGLF